MFKKLEKASPAFASFLSAFSISTYILLVSLVMSNADSLFGPSEDTFLAPFIFLTLLSTSVLVCGFLSLSFPFYLFWSKKDVAKAIKIVGLTAFWLFVFLLSYFVFFLSR